MSDAAEISGGPSFQYVANADSTALETLTTIGDFGRSMQVPPNLLPVVMQVPFGPDKPQTMIIVQGTKPKPHLTPHPSKLTDLLSSSLVPCIFRLRCKENLFTFVYLFVY